MLNISAAIYYYWHQRLIVVQNYIILNIVKSKYIFFFRKAKKKIPLAKRTQDIAITWGKPANLACYTLRDYCCLLWPLTGNVTKHTQALRVTIREYPQTAAARCTMHVKKNDKSYKCLCVAYYRHALTHFSSARADCFHWPYVLCSMRLRLSSGDECISFGTWGSHHCFLQAMTFSMHLKQLSWDLAPPNLMILSWLQVNLFLKWRSSCISTSCSYMIIG